MHFYQFPGGPDTRPVSQARKQASVSVGGHPPCGIPGRLSKSALWKPAHHAEKALRPSRPISLRRCWCSGSSPDRSVSEHLVSQWLSAREPSVGKDVSTGLGEQVQNGRTGDSQEKGQLCDPRCAAQLLSHKPVSFLVTVPHSSVS